MHTDKNGENGIQKDEGLKVIGTNANDAAAINSAAPFDEANKSASEGNAGMASEKKSVEAPTIAIDGEGYFVFKIHFSRGPWYVIGYLNECQYWVRSYFKKLEEQQKQAKKIINPNGVKPSFWQRLTK